MSLRPCWPHSRSDSQSYSHAAGPNSHIAIEGRKLHFWSERVGHEVDFILEEAGKLVALEIKAGLHQVADPPRFWRSSRSSAFDP
jgi:hypothetical protein